MSRSSVILLVDDNPGVAQAIQFAFDCAEHRVDHAKDPEQAYSMLADSSYDAIILDLNFATGRTSGDEGLACLSRIRRDAPSAVIVVITAHSGIRIAVTAMQLGAADFVIKPWRNADLVARVEKAIAGSDRTMPASQTRGSGASGTARLIGNSAPLRRIRDVIQRIASTRANLLVTGPAGSGRSLTAQAFHEASGCTSMQTIDARDISSWDRLATGSETLFLRNVDELTPVEQDRLLDRIPNDSRLASIAGSSAALGPRMYDRLAGVEIVMPPLFERGQDALLLAKHFARLAAERHGRPQTSFTPNAQALILEGRWAEEVRGLARAVDRAVLLSDGAEIDAPALAPKIAEQIASTPVAREAPLDLSLSGSERVMIETALKRHGYNVTHASNALGVSRAALYRRMARYGL